MKGGSNGDRDILVAKDRTSLRHNERWPQRFKLPFAENGGPL